MLKDKTYSSKMKLQKMKRGFTLIEILIVITIIGILSIGAFVPYNLYSNISKVKLSKEIITQTINEARNSAAGLIDIGTKHSQNIAIFVSKGSNNLSLYSYPFDYNGAIEINPSALKIKDVALESGVNINEIKDSALLDQDNIILYFKAPEGIMEVYKTSTSTGSIKNITIGLGGAKTGILSKTLEIK